MATFKAVVRRPRTDGFYSVYIRVTHRRQTLFIKTDKMLTKRELTRGGEISDAFVLQFCTYSHPRQQVSHKKKAVQILGGYFCEGFQRSGSRSRYFSIGAFGGHAAQRSIMSQK